MSSRRVADAKYFHKIQFHKRRIELKSLHKTKQQNKNCIEKKRKTVDVYN